MVRVVVLVNRLRRGLELKAELLDVGILHLGLVELASTSNVRTHQSVMLVAAVGVFHH